MTDPIQEGDEVALAPHPCEGQWGYYPSPVGRKAGDVARVYRIAPSGSIRVQWQSDGYYEDYGYDPGRFVKAGGPW